MQRQDILRNFKYYLRVSPPPLSPAFPFPRIEQRQNHMLQLDLEVTRKFKAIHFLTIHWLCKTESGRKAAFHDIFLYL